MLGEMDADLVPEETLLQYFARMNVPSRVLDMGDAIFANDYAAVSSEVGSSVSRYRANGWGSRVCCTLDKSAAVFPQMVLVFRVQGQGLRGGG
jgi:hypothetical protein